MSTREELVKAVDDAKTAAAADLAAYDAACVAMMGLRNAYYNTLTANDKACYALRAYDKENT